MGHKGVGVGKVRRGRELVGETGAVEARASKLLGCCHV